MPITIRNIKTNSYITPDQFKSMTDPNNQIVEIDGKKKLVNVDTGNVVKTLEDSNTPEVDKDKVASLNSAKALIDQVETLYKEMVGDEYTGAYAGPAARLKGLARGVGSFTGLNQNAREYKNFVDSNLSLIARGLKGEVGTLTNQDIARARGAIPKLSSSPEEATTAFKTIRQQINDNLSAQGVSVAPTTQPKTVGILRKDANLAETEANRSLGSRFMEALPGATAKTLLQNPARFAASAVAAPFDVASQLSGGKPFQGEIPLVGQTFQGATQSRLDQGQNPIFAAGQGALETAGGALETVGIGKGLSKIAPKTPGVRRLFQEGRNARLDEYVNKLVAPKLTAAKGGAFTQGVKQGRVSQSLFGGTKLAPDLKQSQVAAVVKTVPKLKAGMNPVEANNIIFDEIGETAQKLRTSLTSQEIVNTADYSDIRSLVLSAKQQLKENPVLVGDAEQTGQRILDKFMSLLPQNKPITPDAILTARQGLDTWMSNMKGPGIFDPKTDSAISIALRTIRQGANDLIAEKAPDVAVKALLKRQSLLYDAMENIGTKIKPTDPLLKKLGAGAWNTVKYGLLPSVVTGGLLYSTGVGQGR